MQPESTRIAVVGAGVMGRGIALIAARAGFSVALYDLDAQVLDTARIYGEKFLQKSVEKKKMTAETRLRVLDRIIYSTQESALVADFVIEAVPERLDLKRKVLKKLEGLNEAGTPLASNTSTLPITQLATALETPAGLVGMHFFNPAPLMPLVEIISGQQTDPQYAHRTYELAKALGKHPVHARDEPGFIVNRVARPFYVEALRSLEENAADPETLDALMRNAGFRMGPFELMDLIGIDTNHAVTQSLYDAYFGAERFRPSRIQQAKVDAGHLGRKSGKGFYSY